MYLPSAVCTRFQFTHPGKGATESSRETHATDTFQFTHPGKGATDCKSTAPAFQHVSIHAPWEGCDRSAPKKPCYLYGFNSRTLGRVRRLSQLPVVEGVEFQFTHPGKGATHYGVDVPSGRGEVSIHAPWEGCDTHATDTPKTSRMFQFTHPGKGATDSIFTSKNTSFVSIHAPWEGCDVRRGEARTGISRVSIHAPWEGCDASVGLVHCTDIQVSIHAPWEGCDKFGLGRSILLDKFQFTHPGKGATQHHQGEEAQGDCFNSRTLGRVRLALFSKSSRYNLGFNSRTLGRVRLEGLYRLSASNACFNSRTLGRVRLVHRNRVVPIKSFNSRTLGRVRHDI